MLFSGQVRSECLTCKFRASVVAHACHGHRYQPSPVLLFVTGKKEGGGSKEGTACTGGYKGVQAVQPGSVAGKREMFYLTTHSTHFTYGYMASDLWLRTILIVRKETRCHHICYSYRLTAKVLLYAPSHRQDSTYHSLCYTSRGALAGTRNSSMGLPHEGSIRRPTTP